MTEAVPIAAIPTDIHYAPAEQHRDCDRCFYPLVCGLIYCGDQTFALCDFCWAKILREHGDLAPVAAPKRYPYRLGPLKVSPELRRHLLPARMTQAAPTGSPLGLTPSAELVNYCDFNTRGAIDQETAEQQMSEEKPQLWQSWAAARTLGDAKAAEFLHIAVITLKKRKAKARVWLHEKVNVGGIE